MVQCEQCGALLTVPAAGGAVTCPSCWRTNVVGRSAPAAEPGQYVRFCGGCGRRLGEDGAPFCCEGCRQLVHERCWDREAGRCERCVRTGREREQAARLADQRRREVGQAILAHLGKVSSALTWVLRQACLVVPAVTAAALWLALVRKIMARPGFDPSYAGLYEGGTPWVVLAVVYVVFLELDQVFQAWCKRLAAAHQPATLVGLVVWHRVTVLFWRLVTLGLGVGAAVATFYLGDLARLSLQIVPAGQARRWLLAVGELARGDMRDALPLYALLAFVLFAFTPLSRLFFAVSFIGALVLTAAGLRHLEAPALLRVVHDDHACSLTPTGAATLGLFLALVVAYLLYGAMLRSRDHGLCCNCGGYTRRDGPSCEACGRSFSGR